MLQLALIADIIKTLCIIAFAVALVGCGEGMKALKPQSLALSSQCFVNKITAQKASLPQNHKAEILQINFDYLLKNSKNFAQLNSLEPDSSYLKVQSLASTTGLNLPMGTDYVATYRVSCEQEFIKGLPSYFKVSNSANPTKQKRKALSLQLNTSVMVAEVNAWAQDDSCLVSFSEQQPVSLLTAEILWSDPGAPEQSHHNSLKTESALRGFYGAEGIDQDTVVAVIDTGADLGHEDLANQFWENDLGEKGYNFVDDTPDPMDDHGHGTHVSGLLAAQLDNGIGVAGVAGPHVKVMAVKSLDELGEGLVVDVVNGIYYAVDNGADIINLSLATNAKNNAIREAIDFAVQNGVFVVTAAGNQGQRIDATENFISPAGYAPEIEGVVSVGSVDSNGNLSLFSNFDANFVEISAPGAETSSGPNTVGLYSTFPGSIVLPDGTTTQYIHMMGTSMSSPLVAGAAALLMAYFKTHGIAYTPGSIEAFLKAVSPEKAELTNFFESGRSLNLEVLAASARFAKDVGATTLESYLSSGCVP